MMFSRSLRAETRSRAKEDLKRVHKSHEQVRKWEKKWVAVKDTSMLVFKWVPFISVDTTHKKSIFNRSANFPNTANRIFPAYNQNSSDSSDCNGVSVCNRSDATNELTKEEVNGDVSNPDANGKADDNKIDQFHLGDGEIKESVMSEYQLNQKSVEDDQNAFVTDKDEDKHT